MSDQKFVVSPPEKASVVSDIPDLATKNQMLQLELERKTEELEHLKQSRIHRETFSERIFWFLVAWTLFAGLTVLAKGFCPSFKLNESEVIALLTTTTIEVVGLMVIVLKFIFPNNQK